MRVNGSGGGSLAVEIAGVDDDEPAMREKAHWYLSHAVDVVWIVVPNTREIIVLGANFESRLRSGQRMPSNEKLPELSPEVTSFFAQLDRAAP